MSMLQEECDRQAELILSEFRNKRGVRDKMGKVRETMATITHAPSSANLAASVQAASSSSSSSSSHQQQKAVVAKDLDHVLSEMVLLQARSEMYYKFVRKRLTVSTGFSLVLFWLAYCGWIDLAGGHRGVNGGGREETRG